MVEGWRKIIYVGIVHGMVYTIPRCPLRLPDSWKKLVIFRSLVTPFSGPRTWVST